jgi:hypothetical protein
VKHPRTVLAAAIAALTLPAAFAAASTAASAGGIVPRIPSVTVDNAIPPLCAHPELQPTCATINDADNQGHTATYTGTYHAANGVTNDTADSSNPGTCVEGSSATGAKTCRLWFYGGNPKTLCTPNPTTPWYQAKAFGKAWEYTPDETASGSTISGDKLYAEGGGVVDATGVTSSPAGDIVAYRLHIQISSICGNEETAQNLTDTVTTDAGQGGGSVDLSKTYKFSGYFDIG